MASIDEPKVTHEIWVCDVRIGTEWVSDKDLDKETALLRRSRYLAQDEADDKTFGRDEQRFTYRVVKATTTFEEVPT